MTPRVTQSKFPFLLFVGRIHPLLAREFLDILTCKRFCISLILFLSLNFSCLWRKNNLNPKADTCQKSSMESSVKAEHSSPRVAIVSGFSTCSKSPQKRIGKWKLTFTSLAVFTVPLKTLHVRVGFKLPQGWLELSYSGANDIYRDSFLFTGYWKNFTCAVTKEML